MNRLKGCAALVAVAAAYAARAAVLTTQTVTVKPGWNALYAEVAPTASLGRVFADWPVESVGLYEAATLLSTQQFSADMDTQGLAAAPFATWNRNWPEASDAERLAAGTVLVCFGTNTAPVALTLTGVPAAPRLKWHVSGTNDVYNYVGFSLQPGARIVPADYLDGFGGAYLPNRTFWRILGTDKSASPFLVKTSQTTTTVSDGDVLVMHSDVVSDFSGPLFVAPMHGLDFGEEGVLCALTVRNDGATARTASVDLVPDAGSHDLALDCAWLHVRDLAAVGTNTAWTACTGPHIAEKTLAAGETWTLQVGLDRAPLSGKVRGLSFGAVLRVTDVDGRSKMRVDVPLQGETSGGAATARAWPGGLWVGEVALNAVKGPGDAEATETGGTLKLRLPMHLDANGRLRLLQRVVAAGETEADGTYDYRLYAGGATIPATARTVMRISAVCLPTETPVVEADSFDLRSGEAVFEFTVAGGGATSLLRHPYHPQHDGLRWDFKTAAPSGDDVSNYKYDVKPETFSVKSRIAITLDFDGGEASWNPQDSIPGTCEWRLEGLRHEGAITVSGKMTFTRVSPKTEIELE